MNRLINKIQNALLDLNIDAYLIYLYNKQPKWFIEQLDIKGPQTRRTFAIITPKNITWLIPKIESEYYTNLPGKHKLYTKYSDLKKLLSQILPTYKKLAIDFTPNNTIANIDTIPYGVTNLILQYNKNIISSQDILQYILSKWSPYQYKTHKKAVNKIMSIFNDIPKLIISNPNIYDLDILKFIQQQFNAYSLINDHGNISVVAFAQDTANPHYYPTDQRNRKLQPNTLILIDIWAKLADDNNAVYADITRLFWYGNKLPNKINQVWNVYTKTINKSMQFIKDKLHTKRLKGYQIDKYIYSLFKQNGLAKYIVHRTGHSLDIHDHGSGANIDNFESKDTRLIIPNTAFTIEPGIYTTDFGIRSEFDVFIKDDYTYEITVPIQQGIILIKPK